LSGELTSTLIPGVKLNAVLKTLPLSKNVTTIAICVIFDTVGVLQRPDRYSKSYTNRDILNIQEQGKTLERQLTNEELRVNRSLCAACLNG
jgi:hypothetical protein